MDAATIRAQVEDDRAEWDRLRAKLDAHPDGPLHDPEAPDWTSRDVYTHLAQMMQWTAKEIERVAAGEPGARPTRRSQRTTGTPDCASATST